MLEETREVLGEVWKNGGRGVWESVLKCGGRRGGSGKVLGEMCCNHASHVIGCCNHASYVTFLDLLFSPCMLQRLSFCCFIPFLVLSDYTVCYLCILFLC